MATIPVSPLNDIDLIVPLQTVDLTTGAKVPLIPSMMKAVSAFLAASDASTTVSPDPGCDATVVYVGDQPEQEVGDWLIHFDAVGLTPSLMSQLFGSGATPIITIIVDTDQRLTLECEYNDARPGVVENE
jgi:hypothetical protein